MNIFWLDSRPQTAAKYHCDKHIVKMILEYAQLMSTAIRSLGFDVGYRTTHLNHPCAKWVRESRHNAMILYELASYCNVEYRSRFKDQDHASILVIDKLYPFIRCLPDVPDTDPPQCMPDEYKVPGNSVAAYRKYYKYGKADIVTWKYSARPPFMDDSTI